MRNKVIEKAWSIPGTDDDVWFELHCDRSLGWLSFQLQLNWILETRSSAQQRLVGSREAVEVFSISFCIPWFKEKVDKKCHE